VLPSAILKRFTLSSSFSSISFSLAFILYKQNDDMSSWPVFARNAVARCKLSTFSKAGHVHLIMLQQAYKTAGNMLDNVDQLQGQWPEMRQKSMAPDLSTSLCEMVNNGLAQLLRRETIQEGHFATMSLLQSTRKLLSA